VVEAKRGRAVPANPSTDRRPDPSSSPKHPESSDRTIKSGKVESVRSLQQKIEELPSLPSLENSTQPLKPATVPPLTKSEIIPGTSLESAPTPKPVPVGSQKEGAKLGVERIEVKQGVEAGYVAIESYIPARIYVDGQFSGLTPRTVKLSVGDHLIRLIAEGYEDWTRRVKLKTHQQIGVMASMKKKVAQ